MTNDPRKTTIVLSVIWSATSVSSKSERNEMPDQNHTRMVGLLVKQAVRCRSSPQQPATPVCQLSKLKSNFRRRSRAGSRRYFNASPLLNAMKSLVPCAPRKRQQQSGFMQSPAEIEKCTKTTRGQYEIGAENSCSVDAFAAGVAVVTVQLSASVSWYRQRAARQQNI